MDSLQSLRDEVERQLRRRETDPGRQHPAIISIQQQLKEKDYRNQLEDLRHQINRFDGSSTVHWKQALIPDDSIWQVPTFYKNGVAINQSAIKDRILFLRTRRTQNKSITSWMWDEEQVQDWAYGMEPSVLLVMGTSQQRKALDIFGIEAVNNVKPPDVALYLLSPLPDEVADLTTNRVDDVLRQLAIQALQALHPITTLFTLGLLVNVMRLVASGDWFQALAGILTLECRVKKYFTIVVDAGVLRNNFHGANLLPDLFLKLIKEVSGVWVKLKVMIIVGRIIDLDFDPSIKTFSVGSPPKRVRLDGPTTPLGDTVGSPAITANEIVDHSTSTPTSTSEQAIHTVSPNNYSGPGYPEGSDGKAATSLSSLTNTVSKSVESTNLGALQASTTESR
ncbi:hypothetical protein ACHAPI_007822 [Fusarium lateritium]